MTEYMVTCDFYTKHGCEREEIRAYGFLRIHAEKAVRHDNPSAVILYVREVL